MYKLTGVTKDYQKGRQSVAALRGVDLVIEDRDWLAIQGPTGHGKTTLLQILGGLDRPSAGPRPGSSTSTARTWHSCAKRSSPRCAPPRSASCSRPST